MTHDSIVQAERWSGHQDLYTCMFMCRRVWLASLGAAVLCSQGLINQGQVCIQTHAGVNTHERRREWKGQLGYSGAFITIQSWYYDNNCYFVQK